MKSRIKLEYEDMLLEDDVRYADSEGLVHSVSAYRIIGY